MQHTLRYDGMTPFAPHVTLRGAGARFVRRSSLFAAERGTLTMSKSIRKHNESALRYNIIPVYQGIVLILVL